MALASTKILSNVCSSLSIQRRDRQEPALVSGCASKLSTDILAKSQSKAISMASAAEQLRCLTCLWRVRNSLEVFSRSGRTYPILSFQPKRNSKRFIGYEVINPQ